MFNRTLEEIYCKLDYVFQKKKYSVFSKVEYINFNNVTDKVILEPIAKGYDVKKSDTDFLQPIMGYVPFEKSGKIFIAYVVSHIRLGLENNMEFRLRANTKFSNFCYTEYGLKNILKKNILKLLNFIKVSEFYERIMIRQIKYSFYIKK